MLGLAGQSGAGKSVLAMLMAGLLAPDEGEVSFDGQRLTWPFAAQDLGIEVITQRPELVETMDVTSNIFLGHEADWSRGGRWFSVPDRARMEEEASRILAELALDVASLSEMAANLSSEQRQLLAIAKVMGHSSRLVIVDEPTEQLSYRYAAATAGADPDVATARHRGRLRQQGPGAPVCGHRPHRRPPGRCLRRDPSDR